MIGALVIAGLFWATGAIPIGMTALLVAAIMYFFGVFPAGRVAGAFARDPVVFIFGVLALAAAVGKTGLDRRLGLWLLARSGGAGGFLLVFCPLLALAASFISGFALVVVMTPVLVTGYRAAARAQGLKADRGLAAMILLGLAFAANLGGPGSPAATGRNAIMLGMLSDYGVNLSFGQWARLGLPVAPALAFAAGLYLFLVFRRRLQVKSPDLAAEARREREILGPMAGKEYFTAAVLLLLLAAWLFGGGAFGLGGPVLAALLALNLGGVLRWKDVAGIHWDMVALYAAAGALSLGLAATGAAPWLADSLFRRLPDFFQAGDGLALGAGLMGGVAANLLGDGVAVAMLGPFTAPMAGLAGASAVKVGLAYAFATSFAHLTVVATPVNAIVFSLARDPETGDQLVTMRDFFVHGAAVLAIDFAVLWLFAICGYWHWLGT
jgi:sodium-dependent dicarboxylate transporter 2/3/5